MLVLWKIRTPEEGLLEATTNLQRRPSKREKETNATETSSVTGSGIVDEVLSISIGSCHYQLWLLDYGASNHMCLHRHSFITYSL